MEWRDGVTSSLRARGLSVEEARVKALDRVEWKKVVRAQYV